MVGLCNYFKYINIGLIILGCIIWLVPYNHSITEIFLAAKQSDLFENYSLKKNTYESVNEFLQNEISFGLNDYNTYLDFANRIKITKENVNKNINELKQQGLTLVGYGAPAKATTALNYYGITSEQIDYIVEDNKLKHNKIIPGVNIPIYSKDKLNEKLPDVIIVLAWNFFEEVKKNNVELIEKGVKFINIKDLI